MKILFLSRWFPYPTDNGSKLRIWNLLCGLSEIHEITLLSFAEAEPAAADMQALSEICQSVQIVPWHQYNPQSQRARLGLLRLEPRSQIDTFSKEMGMLIKQTLANDKFDLLIASQWQMAGYSQFFGDTPALFEEVELGVFYGQYAGARAVRSQLRYGLTWAKHRLYLARLLKDFQACTVVSEQEQQLLAEAVPDFENVAVIANCIDLASYSGFDTEPQANSLIFTGSFRYTPNYDAMTWFLQDTYKRIQAEVPNVQLTITGDQAGLTLPSMSGVMQTGFVPDVRPYVASTWASVVPLRSGGGTRLKILEAMALGTPVITTTKGAEGLGAKHGKSVLIADEPEEFAAAVVRLFKEPGLRRYLAENAYQLVRDRFDWAGVMPQFLQLIENIVHEHSIAGKPWLTVSSQQGLD